MLNWVVKCPAKNIEHLWSQLSKKTLPSFIVAVKYKFISFYDCKNSELWKENILLTSEMSKKCTNLVFVFCLPSTRKGVSWCWLRKTWLNCINDVKVSVLICPKTIAWVTSSQHLLGSWIKLFSWPNNLPVVVYS